MCTNSNVVFHNVLYGSRVGLYGAAIHFALADKSKLFDDWSVINNVSISCYDTEYIVLTLCRGSSYINVLQHFLECLGGSRFYYIQYIHAASDDDYVATDGSFAASWDEHDQGFDACVDDIIEEIGTVIRSIT